MGAFEEDVHNLYFISEFRFMPDQSEEFEIAVLAEYKSLSPDLNPASAEKKYLEEAMYLGNELLFLFFFNFRNN